MKRLSAPNTSFWLCCQHLESKNKVFITHIEVVFVTLRCFNSPWLMCTNTQALFNVLTASSLHFKCKSVQPLNSIWHQGQWNCPTWTKRHLVWFGKWKPPTPLICLLSHWSWPQQMPSPQRSGRPSSLLFVCFCGGWEKLCCGGRWTCIGRGGGLSGSKALQGESYRVLANKLASDRERAVGGGGGDSVGRGGDSFSQA